MNNIDLWFDDLISIVINIMRGNVNVSFISDSIIFIFCLVIFVMLVCCVIILFFIKFGDDVWFIKLDILFGFYNLNFMLMKCKCMLYEFLYIFNSGV